MSKREIKKNSLTSNDDLATKGDVENIVTRVILKIVPPIVTGIITEIVPGIVNKIIDDKIDAFAVIVGRGFADTQAQINDIKENMVTKKEFNSFKGETERSLFCLQSDVTDLKNRMGRVETRLDGVEDTNRTMISLWRDHET